MENEEIKNGYGSANASSKVCQDIISRLEFVSENSFYMTKLNTSKQKWIDENANTVFDEIKEYFKDLI